MQITWRYGAIPVHQQFHSSRAKERLLFGAFGSGKTYAIMAEAIALCLENPGIRGLIARKYVPDLRDTTETVFFDLLPDEIYRRGKSLRSGGHYSSFEFPNGSVVIFRSLDDWKRLKSFNLGFIAIDEADEIDEETYEGLLSRIRQTDPAREGLPPIERRCIFMAANPQGHNWLWRRFVKEQRQDTAWFKSTSFDNPYLPLDYLDRLLQYPEPWIKRYVMCQFDDFAGQIYEEWSYDRHVIKPFKDQFGRYKYDPNYGFWMGLDPGTRDPTAAVWVVVQPDKHRLVAVAEYEQASLAADVHAAAWRRIEAEHQMRVQWRVSDPSIRVRDRSTNNSLEDTLRRLGFVFNLGPIQEKDRIPPLGNLIHRGQFVVTDDCPLTFEAVRDYQWRDLTPAQRSHDEDPPDHPLKRNTHLVEAAQYLATRYQVPILKKPEYPEDDWSAELRDIIKGKVRQKQLNAQGPRSSMIEGIPF
jgi:PBSX family phage terminase large subunit